MMDEKICERSPLIAATTTVSLNHPNYTVRRFIYFVLVSILAALTYLSLFQILLISYHRIQQIQDRSSFDYEELQSILLKTPKEEKAKEWSQYYTSGPHLAGKNYSQASWTKNLWQEFGINAEIISYDTYLNYPVGHRLALYEAGDNAESWRVKYEASLAEDVIEEDPTTGLCDRIPTFHGYSANGNVTASYVYVNYGTYADYEDLIQANVSLKGNIALARYGDIFRGLKVKRAQELGMVGVITFTDPGDDGAITKQSGIAEYPKGPARQPSSVQRGSTQFLSFRPGDPTTPGYPSKPGVPRQSVEDAIPSIPSIPISFLDAIPLLNALNHYGPSVEDLSRSWQRNLGLKDQGVNYNVGPSPPDLVLNLVNEQDYVITPIWNVIGIINGTSSDEVVILGNHRDAWVAGGAGDPNSGSAALNEVIRSFGQALSKGWKPLRTIVFASWDGEEYGLLGSTEWVEEHLPWLSASSVAYVNVDIGTSGPKFSVAASPLLSHIIHEITSLVPSPNQTIPGQTIADLWNGEIRIIGSGSDFTAFQDLVGISSIDMLFEPDIAQDGYEGHAVYHYHSNYDSFHWMNLYGDPGFHYHATMAKLWGLIIAKLAETPVIPMNATDYALALKVYIVKVAAKLDAVILGQYSEEDLQAARMHPTPSISNGSLFQLKILIKCLFSAAENFVYAARDHDSLAAHVAEKASEGIPWWRLISRFWLKIQIGKVNRKYKYLERAFLYTAGLDGRTFFKHVIFAPGLWTGYSGSVFPGLSESIEMQDWANAERWVRIIKSCILAAQKELL